MPSVTDPAELALASLAPTRLERVRIEKNHGARSQRFWATWQWDPTSRQLAAAIVR